MSMNQTHTSFSSIAWRLVVCLALLAGMFTWLAVPVQAAAPEQRAKVAVLAASLCKRNLVLVGSGFEPNQVYQVTVKERFTKLSLNLGKVRTTKQGWIDTVLDTKLVFRNPVDKFEMTVCVKSKATGKKTCTVASFEP